MINNEAILDNPSVMACNSNTKTNRKIKILFCPKEEGSIGRMKVLLEAYEFYNTTSDKERNRICYTTLQKI